MENETFGILTTGTINDLAAAAIENGLNNLSTCDNPENADTQTCSTGQSNWNIGSIETDDGQIAEVVVSVQATEN